MKLNFVRGVLALGLAAMMVACSGGGEPNFKSEWFSFTDDEGGASGLFNPGTGTVLYEGEFEGSLTSIIDGIFMAREEGSYTVYSAGDKRPKVIGDLEELESVGGVAEGLLPVCRKNSRIEVYSVNVSDAKLAFTLDPIDGKEIIQCGGRYADGLLIVQNEDMEYGAVNKTGQVVIPFDYADISNPVNGLMFARKSSDSSNDKYYLLNAKGEEIFKFKKGIKPDWICDNGYIVCENDNNHIVLATQKEEYFSMPKDVYSIDNFRGDYVVYQNNSGKYGILKVKDGQAEVIVKAKYRRLLLLPWDPAMYVCSKDGEEFAVMDLDNNKTIDFGDDYSIVVPVKTPNWEGFVAIIDDSSENENEFFTPKGDKIKYDGLHGIYNLGYEDVVNYYVSSDYFNIDEFERQMSKAISTSGLCGYTMGSDVNQYFTYGMDPSDYTRTYWFTPKDEPDIKGYKYSSGIQLSGYNILATGQWSYYDYSYDYYFVRNNPIDGMKLNVYGPYGFWDKVGDSIKDIIDRKGYTIKSSENSEIVYYTPSHDATLTVKWSSFSSIEFTYFKNYGGY